MRVLLDTHVFLWAITDDERLPARYRDVYLSESNELVLSMASVWEMLIQCGIGRLALPKPAAGYLSKQLAKNRIQTLGIQMHHLAELEALPPLHRDPFDRIIAAQARAERLTLLSVDVAFHQYGVEML